MSILNKIVNQKKERLTHAKAETSIARLKAVIKDIPLPFEFEQSLKRQEGPIRLIAEVKKASPSKGLIRQDFNHKTIAAVYREKKVNAISVLTEEDFFQGRLEFLADVKTISLLPVLRKDFIFDEYQIYEARANQADAILLIAAILDEKQAEEYLAISKELGMAVLFEVHNHKEHEIALKINAPVVGINNRNLKTLQIDMNTTIKLKKETPADKIGRADGQGEIGVGVQQRHVGGQPRVGHRAGHVGGRQRDAEGGGGG